MAGVTIHNTFLATAPQTQQTTSQPKLTYADGTEVRVGDEFETDMDNNGWPRWDSRPTDGSLLDVGPCTKHGRLVVSHFSTASHGQEAVTLLPADQKPWFWSQAMLKHVRLIRPALGSEPKAHTVAPAPKPKCAWNNQAAPALDIVYPTRPKSMSPWAEDSYVAARQKAEEDGLRRAKRVLSSFPVCHNEGAKIELTFFPDGDPDRDEKEYGRAYWSCDCCTEGVGPNNYHTWTKAAALIPAGSSALNLHHP